LIISTGSKPSKFHVVHDLGGGRIPAAKIPLNINKAIVNSRLHSRGIGTVVLTVTLSLLKNTRGATGPIP